MADKPEKPIEDMTLEEMDSALSETSSDFLESGQEPPPVHVGDSEPEKPEETKEEAESKTDPGVEPQEEREESEPEPVSETRDEQTEETKPEEQPVTEADVLEARIEELRLQKEHWERVSGRHGGQMDLMRRQIENLESRLRSQPTDRDEAEDEGAEPRRKPPERGGTPRADELTLWAVKESMRRAAEEVAARYQDDWQALLPKIQEKLAVSGANVSGLLETNSPAYAAEETARILEDAYYTAKSEAQAATRETLEKKMADQVDRKSRAKANATISGSGSSAPPPRRDKSSDEMSLDELTAALDKATGGRW